MSLRDEISSDPLALGYAKMGAEELLAILLAPTRTRVMPTMVNARTILARCPNGGELLDKLEGIGAHVSAVKWAMRFMTQPEGIDGGSPATWAMLGQLQMSKLITAEEADALRALSVVNCSRLEELGLPTPILAEVIEAMR